MNVILLTPSALVLLPMIAGGAVAVALWVRRRAQRARALGFTVERRPSAASVCAVAAVLLAAVAAAQPALPGTAVRMTRADAQVWVTIDTSNSMLARPSQEGSTRLSQTRAFAAALRGQLASVPVGLAAMTDRVLPLLPPTSDQSIFSTVLKHTMKPDTPPPHSDFRGLVATSLDLLQQVPQQDFFGHAKRRVMVVITDGETRGFKPAQIAASFRSQHEQLIVVRSGGARDRIWLNGHQDSRYRPQFAELGAVEQLARLEHEPLFTTRQVEAVAGAVRQALGDGPMMADGREPVYRSLAPFLLLASLPFLAFTLAVYLGGLLPARLRTSGM
jgi:Mg-chelatase subunit ChlD